MAAANLGRMSGVAREKLLLRPGAGGLGALARTLVLALLLAPVLSGNGRGEAARDRVGPDGDRAPPTHGGSHQPSSRGRSWARDRKRPQCGLPSSEKWGREIPGPEWVGGDGKWRGQSLLRIRSLEEQRSLSGVVPRMLENREFGDLADGMGDRLK